MTKHVRARQRIKLDKVAVFVGLAMPLAAHAQVDTASAIMPEVEVHAQKLGETTEGTASYTTGRAKTYRLRF